MKKALTNLIKVKTTEMRAGAEVSIEQVFPATLVFLPVNDMLIDAVESEI